MHGKEYISFHMAQAAACAATFLPKENAFMKATALKPDKVCMRMLVTIFMFVGVGIFLLPYFTGSMYDGIIFLIIGASIAVSCGFIRCYLTPCDGEKASSKR